MSQIKQILRLRQQGKEKKTIATALGISKTTVKGYLRKADALPYDTDKLLAMDDPELEAKFHAGNPAYCDDRFDHLKSKLAYFTSELQRTGVTKHLLWQEYRQQYPDGYGYSQFCYHLSQHLKATQPSMVLQHTPGEKLYVDFAGKPLSYVDRHTGEIIECQVFVATLPYSDYGFAMAVHTQTVGDFIHALVRCVRFLGGVSQALVPDNLKAAVVKANRYEPTLNHALEDLGNHYGMTVLPARAAKPKDKALVENHVKLLYSRVYARMRNRQFFSLGELNEAIADNMKAHNQTRMQQKDHSREESFLAEERPLLRPLPEEDFELRYYSELTVAKNNHIYLSCDKHYYSVPFAHIGRKVKVIYTRSLVHIYHEGKQVAAHVRDYHKGGYTTDKQHLCSQHNHYLNRSPEYYLQKAADKSDRLHQLFQKLFEQDRYPEQQYRKCDGLLGLQRKTDATVFDNACRMAITHENYSYTFVRNLVENKVATQPELFEDKLLPGHNNIRGKDYYQ